MQSLKVSASNGAYEIRFGTGLLQNAGSHMAGHAGRRAAIVTDSTVGPLYAAKVAGSLQKAGIEPRVFAVPSGENSKCMDCLNFLYSAFCDMGLTRTDCVVALGGGVVGDLAGFAAATFLRGVGLVQMPTTLLAQVDSSVGGKVAVNLPEGKNLVGAFYQPELVLCDSGTLSTLPERERLAGLAEVVKYGAIRRPSIFEELNPIHYENIAHECCAVKGSYVEQDPFDKGARMELNFGHTAGHGIEIASGLKYLHGEGVAIGMGIAARAGERMGLTAPGTAREIGRLCRMYGLPERAENIDREAVLAAMRRDKKSDGKQINVVLIEKMGKAMAYRMTAEELLEQGKYE